MSNMRCRITTEQLHHIWQQLLRTGLNFIPWMELFQYFLSVVLGLERKYQEISAYLKIAIMSNKENSS